MNKKQFYSIPFSCKTFSSELLFAEWTWRTLASSFKNIWGSSAFKGANNPSSQFIDIQHYVANNRAWLQQKYVESFNYLFKESISL